MGDQGECRTGGSVITTMEGETGAGPVLSCVK